jgi:hypothetical protein
LFKDNSSGNKRSRKYKLIYYLPELLTICYLVAYGIAEHNYYSNPRLAELAREGFTTRGHWTEDSFPGIVLPIEHSMEAFKPWILPDGFPPVMRYIDGPIMDPILGVRPLTFIETDMGGALLGLVPVGLKYSIVAISRYRKSR